VLGTNEKVVNFNLNGLPEAGNDYHSVLSLIVTVFRDVFELQWMSGSTGKVTYLMGKRKKLLVSQISSIWYKYIK